METKEKAVGGTGERDLVPLDWRQPRSLPLLGITLHSPFLWQPSGEESIPQDSLKLSLFTLSCHLLPHLPHTLLPHTSFHTLPFTHLRHTSHMYISHCDSADTPSPLLTHPNNDLHCLQLQVLLVTVQHVLQLPMSTEREDICSQRHFRGCSVCDRLHRTSANERTVGHAYRGGDIVEAHYVGLSTRSRKSGLNPQ